MQLLFLLNFACVTEGPGYSGFGTKGYFGFDGERLWTYNLDSEEEGESGQKLSVEKLSPEFEEGMERVTFEYFVEDPYQVLGSVSWIAGSIDGIGIESYTIGEGDNMEEVIFDDLAIFAENRMAPGDVVESTINGITISSSLNGVEECPNDWATGDVWECLHFTVSTDQENSGLPFLGEHWLANGYGSSRFQVSEGPWASDVNWVLLGTEYENTQ